MNMNFALFESFRFDLDYDFTVENMKEFVKNGFMVYIQSLKQRDVWPWEKQKTQIWLNIEFENLWGDQLQMWILSLYFPVVLLRNKERADIAEKVKYEMLFS